MHARADPIMILSWVCAQAVPRWQQEQADKGGGQLSIWPATWDQGAGTKNSNIFSL